MKITNTALSYRSSEELAASFRDEDVHTRGRTASGVGSQLRDHAPIRS